MSNDITFILILNKTFDTRFIGWHRSDKTATSDISQVNHLQSIYILNPHTKKCNKCSLISQKGQSMISFYSAFRKKGHKIKRNRCCFVFVRWSGDKTLCWACILFKIQSNWHNKSGWWTVESIALNRNRWHFCMVCSVMSVFRVWCAKLSNNILINYPWPIQNFIHIGFYLLWSKESHSVLFFLFAQWNSIAACFCLSHFRAFFGFEHSLDGLTWRATRLLEFRIAFFSFIAIALDNKMRFSVFRRSALVNRWPKSLMSVDFVVPFLAIPTR